MVGQLVSHYRVLRRIGQGGMGEVYLAHDLSLGRPVALKFVTQADVSEPGASRRLRREAHAAAALDHPFVCKIYETGESDGRTYLAMEYVEGRTLRDYIAAGPVPASDALRIAIEIAEALECAHAHGIVHRDLKPANVMVGADGHVKVMDFGIAARCAPVDQSTRTALDATRVGVVSGTIAYSSPEQLRALPVDARSDVFSFGLLLYEMVAGKHPFAGPSMAATVDALLNAPTPPLPTAMPAAVAAVLEPVVPRCLEKDPERRFASFQDVRTALQSGAAAPAKASSSRRRRGRAAAVALALLIVAVAVGMATRIMPGWLRLSEPALAFNARDWMVITDCENLTGDPVFDRSLGVALDVGIAQSNYVNVFSRDRVRVTLQRMRKAPRRLSIWRSPPRLRNARTCAPC